MEEQGLSRDYYLQQAKTWLEEARRDGKMVVVSLGFVTRCLERAGAKFKDIGTSAREIRSIRERSAIADAQQFVPQLADDPGAIFRVWTCLAYGGISHRRLGFSDEEYDQLWYEGCYANAVSLYKLLSREHVSALDFGTLVYYLQQGGLSPGDIGATRQSLAVLRYRACVRTARGELLRSRSLRRKYDERDVPIVQRIVVIRRYLRLARVRLGIIGTSAVELRRLIKWERDHHPDRARVGEQRGSFSRLFSFV